MIPTAQKVVPNAHDVTDHVTLDYDARFLRRKMLKTQSGLEVLVDLPKTTSLMDGDALETNDGLRIGICAAPEPLLEITGQGLHRIAWHIGNRHTPCQIEDTRLFIQQNHVMAQMLAQLGAHVRAVTLPFTPEGGAYGHGRTHGHDHGAQHGPDTAHSHEH
ncbi:Urease accessory protein UreE 1 [Roseobacter fucihabitans]|uniref:Urease accessory protein UreE n=1 Tax=Roseobacter fucihabitans TaxID=1537242 RepID=A0ABZ2BR58_9RHOB|nr:urease accessory protein UreE [Roseobacter litoralis]MBC6965407.1 Urease accessory protein UreE 1 [Roseobacter litoralis]